jgi:hypothetical protein
MKINVEYTNEMIKGLILNDIEEKLNKFNEIDFEIKVRSKQNYREKRMGSRRITSKTRNRIIKK